MSDLLSKATARVIDLISEGEIAGLVNGDKSIYFGKVPLQNSDNSYNFEGVRTETRNGTLNQGVIRGFRDVETTIAVGSQVKVISPISFTITDADIDAVIVTVGVNTFSDTDLDDGDIHDTSVDLRIDLQASGGSYVEVAKILIDGKTNTFYDRSKRIELASAFPYNIRVRRITADSVSIDVQNDTYLRSYTLINDVKLNYAHSALVATVVDAEKFGSNFPDRRFHVEGILCKYPSNYNPVTRNYIGIWDGTFVTGFTNNPAWVLMDIATKLRYGLGDILNTANIGKFDLYAIAQYCDGNVPDGAGGTEPRFKFNGVIDTLEDAARVLDTIAGVFRGMIYWGTGAVAFTQDRPGTVYKLVTPANVIGGDFSYPGSGRKARHSAVVVAWSDPDQLGEQNLEPVVNDRLIAKYGYVPAPQIVAVGCTSVGQARRVGEWLLDTEEHETQMVIYRCALDHMDVRPGHIITISDPHYMNVRYGGRIMQTAVNLKSITIDAPVDITSGDTFTVSITLRNGDIETRTLTNAAGNNQSVLTWTTALPSEPIANAVWSLASSDVEPRPFRVLTVSERDDQYEVRALFHDVTKYARVERNRTINPPPYALKGRLLQPINTDITEYTFDNGDDLVPAVLLSWGPTNDARARSFELQVWDGNDKQWGRLREVRGHSFDYRQCPKGDLKFRVRSVADNYKPSAWLVSSTYTVQGFAFPTPATTLAADGESNRVVLSTTDNPNPKFKRWVWYGSQTNNFGTANIIGYSTGHRWTHDHLVAGQLWYYWVRAQNKKGDVSDRFPASGVPNNGVSGLVGYITEADTDPTTPATPTGLAVDQETKRDKDGRISTIVRIVCNLAAGATDRWTYIFFVDDGVNPEYTIVVNPNTETPTQKVRTQIRGAIVGRTYSIRVLARSGTNKIGTISSALTITPVKKVSDLPTPSGVTIKSGVARNRLDWNDVNTDTYPDYMETVIWRAVHSGSPVAPTPGVTSPYKKVKAGHFDDGEIAYTTNFDYWIAHRDTSGNYTAVVGEFTSQPKYVLSSDTDQSVLAAPGGVTLDQTSKVVDAGDGRVEIGLEGNWNAVSGADYYTVQITKNGTIIDNVNTSNRRRVKFGGTVGDTFGIVVTAFRFGGVAGNPASEVTKIPTKKSAAPNNPTGLTATNNIYGQIGLEWDMPSDPDYGFTLVQKNITGNYADGVTNVKRLSGDGWIDRGLGNGVTRYYWITHYDKSGNPSQRHPSGAGLTGVLGQTRRILTDDIANGEVKNGNLDTNAVSEKKVIKNSVINKAFGKVKSGNMNRTTTGKTTVTGMFQNDNNKKTGTNEKKCSIRNPNPSPIFVGYELNVGITIVGYNDGTGSVIGYNHTGSISVSLIDDTNNQKYLLIVIPCDGKKRSVNKKIKGSFFTTKIKAGTTDFLCRAVLQLKRDGGNVGSASAIVKGKFTFIDWKR